MGEEGVDLAGRGRAEGDSSAEHEGGGGDDADPPEAVATLIAGPLEHARLLGRRDPGPFDPARLLPVTYAVAVLMIGMSVLLIYADIVKPVRLF